MKMKMKMKISGRARALAWLLTIVYFASYLTRKNFNVMISAIAESMATGNAPGALEAMETELSVIPVGLTIAYAVGQILSGLLGDRIKPQYLLTFGLGLAAVCNIVMPFASSSVPWMTVIWSINGLAHAMLWPPIIRLMSMNLSGEEYAYAAVRVSWGSSIATIFLYLICPLLLSVLDWTVILMLCAAGGILINLIWTFTNKRLLGGASEKESEKVPSSAAEKPRRVPLPGFVFAAVALIMLGIILQGMLRDGVETWMPSYLLKTFGWPAEYAILATVILAVFSIVSFSAFDLLHRKLLRNEVFCSAAIFVLSALCAFALYIVNLAVGSDNTAPVFAMVMMAIITSCMHGINLMLITVVPKRFVKSGRVATFSGILNACTYVGSAVAVYSFAVIKDVLGWDAVILIWGIVSVLGVAVCLAATPIWRKFRRVYSDNDEV